MGVLALMQLAHGFWLIWPEQYLKHVDSCQEMLGKILATANEG